MNKALVSIITPCYNGEKFLNRYFNSMLNQTYENIEIIFIDDGSIDNTQKIVEEYKKKFKERNIELKYIYQENKGQAAAINRGLEEFKGDYFMWPDSDDCLEKDAIEKGVRFLEENQEYGIVRTEANIIDEDTNQIIGKFEIKDCEKTNIFEDLIFGNNVFYTPVTYMLRTKSFLKVKKNKKIFETRYGQNWQILLPITYSYKCGCIKEKLANYYVRKNSHSRKKSCSIDEEIFKLEKHQEILYEVLSEMNLYEKYEEKIDNMFAIKKVVASFTYLDRDTAKKYILLINDKTNMKKKEKIILIIIRNKILFNLYKMYKKIKNKIKG